MLTDTENPAQITVSPPPQTSNCDPSYPDFCISSPPPDLNCGDMSQKRFTVAGSDPHGFDGDGDGIGCES
jgi:micrococcal nuclease